MNASLSEPRNRYVQVVESLTFNGLDFVELATVDAVALQVHFLNKVPVWKPGMVASISGGDSITEITVQPISEADWSQDPQGRPMLALRVNKPGDFSTYTLTISGAPLDVMYASVAFSFKVLCPSDFDCAPPPSSCPPDMTPIPAIDYTAKDFQSFKQALTDFSALRYPAWQERAEADFGVMFLEALCAVADELSYLQDRVAAEATLQTATQRRSLVSLARLVNYEPIPALSASTLIQCNVVDSSPIPAGVMVSATAADGSVVPFEIGTGVADTTSYQVSSAWNDGIQAYWLDDSLRCLPRGSTAMYVLGHGFNFRAEPNLALLIQTDLPGESIREVVHLLSAVEGVDPFFPPQGSTAFTYITWDASEALERDHDLTVTHLAGNLLPATQGRRCRETFAIGAAPASVGALPSAIARRGPNGTDSQPNWVFRYPFAQGRVAWLAPAGAATLDPSLDRAVPEVSVTQRVPESLPVNWPFFTTLLEAGSTEAAFTIDPAAWRAVSTDSQGNPTQWEYDGDQGDTLRFGENVFGLQPAEGTVFDVLYRVGLGAAGNVAPDAISVVDPAASGLLTSARNPFIVTNGADAESAEHIQRMAPQAFRAVAYRAVRPEDYQAAAESLPWVLRAGTAFRWTGSWLTVFTVADPMGNQSATPAQQRSLIDLLNRRRLAGYESYAPSPTLVAIDVQITVCAVSGWLSGNVEAAVLRALSDAVLPNGSTGFFYANRFTFGTPLYRSALEAAIASVAGVNGVLAILYRRSGATLTFSPLPEILSLGSDEVLRIENNPDYPSRGTIRVFVEGAQ